MREYEMRAMHEANARRNALLFGQFDFLNTRILAYEDVLRRPWVAIRAVFQPLWFLEQVDKQHSVRLMESRAKMQEAAKKPKLTMVSANGTH